MARKEDAEKAVLDPNPTIDGRRANVNLAYMGAKNRTASVPCTSSELDARAKELFFFLADSYSLLARMPTYQSTPNAYPYVLLFFKWDFASLRWEKPVHYLFFNSIIRKMPTRLSSSFVSLSLSPLALLLCLSFDWNEIQVEWKHFLPWGMTMNRSQFQVVKTKVKVE